MRKLAIFAASFAAGVFLAQYLLPTGWLLPVALLCFFLGCAALFLPTAIRRRGLLICLGVSLALGYDWLYLRQVQQPMMALSDTAAELTMTLRDYPAVTDYGAKVTVEVDGLPGGLIYYGSEALRDLRPGQTVTAKVYLQNAAKMRDADVTTFTSKGVFLLAYQRGEETARSGSEDAMRWWPVRAGHAMRKQVNLLFRGDAAGFVTAMLTGDKSGLSEEAGAALSECGLYHILAVSGMHCGFLLSFVILLAGRHRRRLAAAVAIPVLLFYALLTGGSPSVVRACVMLSMLMAAPLFGRESDSPTSLLAALLLILLQNPFAIASISLQLSFAAVAGLLWLTPKLYRLLCGEKRHGKGWNYIAAGFSATMGALVFSTPISAYHFGTLPLVSLVSNLLCLWAAGIVFVLSLLAVLCSFVFWPLGVALSALPRGLTAYILGCARVLTKVPFHSVYFANPYLKYWLVFTYLLFGAAYLLKMKSRRKYGLSAVLAVLTLCMTVHLGQKQYRNDLDIVVLDVGQGQSVVLTSDDAYMLADCGSGNSWYDAGEIAAHQLQTMGCRKLDYLLLTHYDTDHVSGVAGLLARMKVGTLLVPGGQDDAGLRDLVWETAHQHGVTVQVVREPTALVLGQAAVTVFPAIGGSTDNETGLSLLASVGEQNFLLTGDMDTAAERRLLETYELPDIELLMAGHHGSKYSTSDDLLQVLQPETVCISVGSNSYGHPGDETMRRLAVCGCAIYRTDLQGNIHLSINEGDKHGIREEKKQ